jgi:hypothetical protein
VIRYTVPALAGPPPADVVLSLMNPTTIFGMRIEVDERLHRLDDGHAPWR